MKLVKGLVLHNYPNAHKALLMGLLEDSWPNSKFFKMED